MNETKQEKYENYKVLKDKLKKRSPQNFFMKRYSSSTRFLKIERNQRLSMQG